MAVVGFESKPVVDDYEIPVSTSAVVSGILHDPIGGCPDRFVVFGSQIDTGMKLRAAGDRVDSPPEGARCPFVRQGHTIGNDRKDECQLCGGECDVA